MSDPSNYTDYFDYLYDLPQNPRDIILNYTSYEGPVSITFGDIDTYVKTVVVLAIVFGTRIGLSALAFPVTFLVTKNRRSPIFMLNMACLGILFIQSCLYAVSLTKYYNTTSYYFSLYPTIDRLASNITVASNVFYVILIILVEISFCYQVYIIFESPQTYLKRLGYLATAFSASLGIASIVLYFIYMCYSNIALFNAEADMPNYLVNTPLILFVTSSCAICLMLMLKLGFAIRTRRYLGLTQFNLFHILFIMAFQTMVIPTILILISFNAFSTTDTYSSQTFSALGSALITISLPITTMWANSSVANSIPTSTFNMHSPYASSDDNKTLPDSPTDYYPKLSLSDSEISPNINDAENNKNINNNEYPNMEGINSSAKDDAAFWKEVEMYTKDLDKNSQNGSILEKNSSKSNEVDSLLQQKLSSNSNSNNSTKN
ncbi:hypothetical protein C6P40_004093 [Pichia californica]|uniref:Pheromone alpha factor receptor n=1 Tax=Pichia californica TaxID=460514 RepID=A0A9P6WN43_9ASCO|nr:hypothetical protein C6P42_004635 [[Candida] californica]KAG0689981.1 hypothetical protein C6P40_004093 [[Candida] californica]